MRVRRRRGVHRAERPDRDLRRRRDRLPDRRGDLAVARHRHAGVARRDAGEAARVDRLLTAPELLLPLRVGIDRRDHHAIAGELGREDAVARAVPRDRRHRRFQVRRHVGRGAARRRHDVHVAAGDRFVAHDAADVRDPLARRRTSAATRSAARDGGSARRRRSSRRSCRARRPTSSRRRCRARPSRRSAYRRATSRTRTR